MEGDALELRMVLIDPNAGAGGGASVSPPPPAPSAPSAPPPPIPPVGAAPTAPQAAAGQTVTIGGTKLTAAQVAALAGQSPAFAEAVGATAGTANRRRATGDEPETESDPAERSRQRVRREGQSRSKGGLFPEGFSSRGEVKTPLFPPGYSSGGEQFVGQEAAAKAAQEAAAKTAGHAAASKIFGFAAQAASNPLGAAASAASSFGPQAALIAAGVAAAVAVAKVVSDAMVAGIERVGRTAQQAGGIGVALAGNRNRAAYAGSLNAAADAIESAPVPLRREAAAIARAGSQVVDAFGKVTDAFIQRGRELARYSPELAMASGRALVREIGSDVREAQELGPALARLTDAEGEIAADLRALVLPIKKFLVEELAGFLEFARTSLGLLTHPTETIKEQGESWLLKLIGFLDPRFKVTTDLLGTLLEQQTQNKNGPVDGLFDNFLRLGKKENQSNFKRDNGILKRARDQRLNVPVFHGL
jgi:hypothetical protein